MFASSSSRTPQQATSTLSQSRKHPAPKQTSIGYPILSPSELLDCLVELGAHLSHEDLIKPTATTVQNAWGAVLHYFTGVSLGGLERPKGAMLSMVTYPVRSLSSSNHFIRPPVHTRLQDDAACFERSVRLGTFE